MAATRVVGTPELLALIFEFSPLSRLDYARFARVSWFWHHPATIALWKHIRSLEPLLCLLPRGSYEWCYRARKINGRVKTYRARLRLHLSDEQCKALLRRTRLIRHLTLRYRFCMMDLCILCAFTSRVEPRLGVLLPRLRILTIHPPENFWSINFVPYFPPTLIRREWESQSTFDVTRIVSHFPQASTFFVGRQVDSPTHLRALHISGLTASSVICLLTSRPSWRVEEVCIKLDDDPVPSLMALLSLCVVWSCRKTRRLRIIVNGFDDGQIWMMSPDIFQYLQYLPDLIDLAIEAPLISQLSDADWEAAARHWPLMESLRVVPGSEEGWKNGALPTTGATPACTMTAVLVIVRACPCLRALALPGVDCRALPSTTRVQQIMAHDSRPYKVEHPMRELAICDSPLRDPGALSRLLRIVFPHLHELTYRQFPCLDGENVQMEEEYGSERWNMVNRYLSRVDSGVIA